MNVPSSGIYAAPVITTNTLMRITASALLTGGVAFGAFGLSVGTAQANSGPCPESPYFCWCPGQPLPKSGAPITWDMNVCHNFRYRLWGPGEQIPPPAGYCPPALLSDNWYDRC
jgi:hypothetical protein